MTAPARSTQSIRNQLDEPKPAPTMTLVCACCGKPATCVGAYEQDAIGETPNVQPACDDCCGHGNEDGFCDPIVDDGLREAWEADVHARARAFGGE